MSAKQTLYLPPFPNPPTFYLFVESITLLLVLATFIVALLNLRNFGKGLMQQLKNKPNLAPIATPNSSSTSRRQQQQHQHSSSLHNNNINSATNSSTTIASPPSSSSLLQPYHSNASVPSRQAPPPPPPSSKKTLPTRWTLE